MTDDPKCVRAGIEMTHSQWMLVPLVIRNRYWHETEWGKGGPASRETVALIRKYLEDPWPSK